ncbi:limbic system-associated membrane protein-like [Aphis gossypii]|uniref:limbic system-associated membrane protein-like n=1 Tax=Aphis gossypii TaxID=80765 RepID=UPI0021596DD5|nr:limbic system-associated membrane protein-like [Aphis gossypii]XP_050057127.1 limbic system-associated membrane protein-like [Aphis gossypii]
MEAMVFWCYWNNFGIQYLIFAITSIKMVLDAKPIVPAESSKEEISPYWSFNETADISKYEDFDHRKFLEHELHLDVSDPENADEIQPSVKLRTTTLAPSTPTPEPIIHVGTTNVTVQLGSTALLHCEIANISEKMVSWVRRRDWHILSSGVLTYINDGRFRVFHSEKSDDWDLRISPVAKIDNGTYECQVGTGTGIMTHYFNLFVIVPTAVISGSDEYHTPEGNSIVLCCKIENSPVPPQYVLWYHNGKVISASHFNKNGLKPDRLSISTEQIDRKIHSRLTITKAIQIDTGNYTCQPPNTDPDSTYIHITPEIDNTAAIQRHKSSNSALLVTELSIFPLASFLLIGHNGFRWVFL